MRLRSCKWRPVKGSVSNEAAGHMEAGEPAEDETKEISDDDPHKERRRGDTEYADENSGGIHPGILADGGEHAQADAGDRSKQHGSEGEQDGAGKGFYQDVPNLSFRLIGAAEIRPFDGKNGVAADEDAFEAFLGDLFAGVDGDR